MNIIKCEICGKECGNHAWLNRHISKFHITYGLEEYYNKYISNCPPTLCVVCNKKSSFISLTKGYRKTCSQTCARKLMHTEESREKARMTCIKKFGVENPSILKEIKEKISLTQKKRMTNPENRKRISECTKRAMANELVRYNLLSAIKKPKSKETIQKLSISSREKFKKYPHLKSKIYTEKRNSIISKKKKLYWETHPEERKKIGLNWKKWKERDEIGWKQHLQKISKKGFEKIFYPDGDTSLEVKLYDMLSEEKINYIKKYDLEGKIYDAYLPDYKTLIEIDGNFWHKETLDECKYYFQRESFYNDKQKNDIALKNGIKLLRIKENSIPSTIRSIL